MPDDSAFVYFPSAKERSPLYFFNRFSFSKYDRPYLPKVRSPLFSNQPIVLCVRTNPKPQNTCFNFYTQRPISLSSPYRAIITNLLKMQRRMRRICLQQLITLICCSLYI